MEIRRIDREGTPIGFRKISPGTGKIISNIPNLPRYQCTVTNVEDYQKLRTAMMDAFEQGIEVWEESSPGKRVFHINRDDRKILLEEVYVVSFVPKTYDQLDVVFSIMEKLFVAGK